jgi:hypothetical protein
LVTESIRWSYSRPRRRIRKTTRKDNKNICKQRCLCNLAEAAPTGVDVNIFSQGTFGRGGGAECYTVYWIASTISVIFRLIIETMMGLWPSFHRLFVRSFQKRIDRSPLCYSLPEPKKLNPFSLSLSVLLLLLMQASAPISISLCRHKTMEEGKVQVGKKELLHWIRNPHHTLPSTRFHK